MIDNLLEKNLKIIKSSQREYKAKYPKSKTAEEIRSNQIKVLGNEILKLLPTEDLILDTEFIEQLGKEEWFNEDVLTALDWLIDNDKVIVTTKGNKTYLARNFS